MPIFELDEGAPSLVQPMQPLPGSFAQDCASLLTHHLRAIAGEPLFPVRARGQASEHANVPELLALDSTGRPVVIEVVQVLDDDAVLRCLHHAGAAARMTATDLARAYHADPVRFGVDFAAFREQVAFGAQTSRREGVRLVVVCSEVAAEAGDALGYLHGPGRHVDVLQVGVLRGVDDRRLLEVSPLARHETVRRSVEPTALRLVRSSEASFATAMAYEGERRRPPSPAAGAVSSGAGAVSSGAGAVSPGAGHESPSNAGLAGASATEPAPPAYANPAHVNPGRGIGENVPPVVRGAGALPGPLPAASAFPGTPPSGAARGGSVTRASAFPTRTSSVPAVDAPPSFPPAVPPPPANLEPAARPWEAFDEGAPPPVGHRDPSAATPAVASSAVAPAPTPSVTPAAAAPAAANQTGASSAGAYVPTAFAPTHPAAARTPLSSPVRVSTAPAPTGAIPDLRDLVPSQGSPAPYPGSPATRARLDERDLTEPAPGIPRDRVGDLPPAPAPSVPASAASVPFPAVPVPAPAPAPDADGPHPLLTTLAKSRRAVTTLVWLRERRGQRITATLRPDGLIELQDGQVFAHPSDAATVAADTPNVVDGWRAWRLGDSGPTLAQATGHDAP